MDDRADYLRCTTGKRNCSIDSKSRRSCPFCRYEKCLAAGMKPAWIMTAEERKAKKELLRFGRHRGAGKIRGKKVASTNLVAPPLREPVIGLTTEEALVIDRTVSSALSTFFNSQCDTLKVDASPVLAIHDMILMGKNARASFVRLFENNCRNWFKAVFAQMEDKIHPDDKAIIMEHNFGTFFSILSAIYFDPRDFLKLTIALFRYMRQRAGEDDVFDLVEDVYKEISLGGLRPNFGYDQVRPGESGGMIPYYRTWCLIAGVRFPLVTQLQ